MLLLQFEGVNETSLFIEAMSCRAANVFKMFTLFSGTYISLKSYYLNWVAVEDVKDAGKKLKDGLTS